MSQYGTGIPEIPADTPVATRQTLTAMRQEILRLRGSRTTPDLVTNLRVTPIQTGNVVDWTRAMNASTYIVYWGTTPNINAATMQDVGDIQRWSHLYGQSGVTLFYWVVSVSNSGQRSLPLGYKSGTTLAAGVSTVVPSPSLPVSQINVNPVLGRPDLGSGGGNFE